ncbi:MAG: cytidylate kinase family protein, partial [Candidatus Cryptobacteroides sp.]
MNAKIKDILVRYSVATFGLALVAIGVALSISSNLGTSPISCPPYVMALWGGLTVGEYTALMHQIFIILQLIL